MFTVTIKRHKEKEIYQAIEGLEKRGYELISPPKQISKDGKLFRADERKRMIFNNNTFQSFWIAKMRKADKDGIKI
jgi:hypothetical protein